MKIFLALTLAASAFGAGAQVIPTASNYYGQYQGTYANGLPSSGGTFGSPVSHSPYTPPPSGDTQTAGLVEHFVAFHFRADATPDEVNEVIAAFRALKDQIPSIVSLEDGENNSPEGQNKGFTHAFLVSFASTADRDEYVNVAPAHQAFKKLAAKYVDDVFVFDFSAR